MAECLKKKRSEFMAECLKKKMAEYLKLKDVDEWCCRMSEVGRSKWHGRMSESNKVNNMV